MQTKEWLTDDIIVKYILDISDLELVKKYSHNTFGHNAALSVQRSSFPPSHQTKWCLLHCSLFLNTKELQCCHLIIEMSFIMFYGVLCKLKEIPFLEAVRQL